MNSRWTHLVIWQRDADPPEVYPFESLDEALEFYERASQQWTGVYLCSILKAGQGVIERMARTSESPVGQCRIDPARTDAMHVLPCLEAEILIGELRDGKIERSTLQEHLKRCLWSPPLAMTIEQGMDLLRSLVSQWKERAERAEAALQAGGGKASHRKEQPR